jgi:Ser/Thr protein kinase RdoA (MazF antagonist)
LLDFEFSRIAPVELDLAQVCSTLLMWSGFDEETALGEMRRVLRSYEDVRGAGVNEQGVFACMAAYWFNNYRFWLDTFEHSGAHRDVLERQPGRIRSVLSFLERALA